MKLVGAERVLNSEHSRWRWIEIKMCLQILKIEEKAFLIKGGASSEEKYVDGAHDVGICWADGLIEARNAEELNEKLAERVLIEGGFDQAE